MEMEYTYNDNETIIKKIKEGHEELKEVLFKANKGLLQNIANKFSKRNVGLTEDLFQQACIGFLKALKDFDTTIGFKFTTYSIPRIEGYVKQFMRDYNIMTLPREVTENKYKFKYCVSKLQKKLQRFPTRKEIQEEMGIKKESIDILLSYLNTKTFINLDEKRYENNETITKEQILKGSILEEEKIITKIELRKAIKKLEPRLYKIIILYFYKDFTQKEIGKMLKMSQPHVGREYRKAIKFLRKELGVKINEEPKQTRKPKKDIINELFREGKTNEEVVEITNSSFAMVRSYRTLYNKSIGLPPMRKSKKRINSGR